MGKGRNDQSIPLSFVQITTQTSAARTSSYQNQPHSALTMKLTFVCILALLAGIESVTAICCVQGNPGACDRAMSAKRAGLPVEHVVRSRIAPLICCCSAAEDQCVARCVSPVEAFSDLTSAARSRYVGLRNNIERSANDQNAACLKVEADERRGGSIHWHYTDSEVYANAWYCIVL